METNPVFAVPCPDFLTTGKCNKKCKYCFEPEKIPDDIDSKLVKEYLSHNPCTSGMIFGGEPLMAIDKVCEILDAIRNNPSVTKKRRDATLKKCRNLITNGTLIHKYIDIIKKYDLGAQISVDGCKEAHNLNRVYADGSGSWDDCIEAIQLCIDNDIKWSVHGVVCKNTLPYIFESFKWFFNIYADNVKDGIKYSVNHLQHNTFQVVFEDDYTDEDVDIIIEQFSLIADWIVTHEKLTENQKIKLFDNWFLKTGGTCGVGTGLLALDADLNIFPCHRTVFGKAREETKLGNVFKPEEFDESKFILYNAFHNVGKKKRFMYSVVTNISNWKDKVSNAWFMWCPATNLQETGSPYFQPVKYNIMFTEINRLIRTLRMAYFGKGRPNNTSSV